MKRWRVIEIKRKAIVAEFYQEDPPDLQGAWKDPLQYTLEWANLSSDEIAFYNASMRQGDLANWIPEFLDAYFLKEKGDSSAMDVLLDKFEKLLQQYPTKE